jgi:hypothetical protein
MAALQVVQLLQALAVVWREAWARKLRLLNRKQQENERHVRMSGNHFHEEKGC